MSTTHLANRQAFYRHRIIPRMLVDTNTRDTATTVFGHKVSAPLGFAPIGTNKIYNPAGELPVAKFAKELNLPTASPPPAASRLRTLPHDDDDLTISLPTRAHESGFTACIVTLNTPQLGWRHDDVANSIYAFYHGLGADRALGPAVGDEPYIMYDSGIRGASDVVKALALGAKYVFVGRLWVWSLSIMGEHGVRHVMKSLLAELDILFNVSGIQRVDQIDKSYNLVQERSKL
ncbi:hypothetical protein MBLNU13_g01931t1 [Cladosporium sp. NU13]